MIQANELRVGNWINIQGNFKKVLGIDYLYKEHLIISDGYYQLDWCEPIPLTEEILLKCGFKGRIDFKWKNNVGIQIIEGKYYFAFKDLGNVLFHSLIECKNLHQLQNLVFALTNEELKIEL